MIIGLAEERQALAAIALDFPEPGVCAKYTLPVRTHRNINWRRTH